MEQTASIYLELLQIPDRRTLDRRFQVLPINIIISTMGNRFVSEEMLENDSVSIDSSMLKAAGPVWHKSDITNNHLPIAGIDTGGKWGYSKSKGWIFGYKLHMSCSTGKLIVPLSADVTTTNVHDGKMYHTLVESLAGLVENVLCDPAYDDYKLYQFSNRRNLRLIVPIKVYPRTPPDRIKLVEFYNSVIGRKLYSDRKISIEPLFEIIKDTFGIRSPSKRIVQCKIICVDLCTCVSVGSVL